MHIEKKIGFDKNVLLLYFSSFLYYMYILHTHTQAHTGICTHTHTHACTHALHCTALYCTVSHCIALHRAAYMVCLLFYYFNNFCLSKSKTWCSN